MKIVYTGHYVNESLQVVVCFTWSVGGGPARFESVKVPARHLDNRDVHDAMASAAMALLEDHSSPPWEQDALDLY